MLNNHSLHVLSYNPLIISLAPSLPRSLPSYLPLFCLADSSLHLLHLPFPSFVPSVFLVATAACSRQLLPHQSAYCYLGHESLMRARNSQLLCAMCVGRRRLDIMLSAWSDDGESLQQTKDTELLFIHEEKNLKYI